MQKNKTRKSIWCNLYISCCAVGASERAKESRETFDNNIVIIGNCVLFCAKKFTCVHAKNKMEKAIQNYAKPKPTQAFMQFTSFRDWRRTRSKCFAIP